MDDYQLERTAYKVIDSIEDLEYIPNVISNLIAAVNAKEEEITDFQKEIEKLELEVNNLKDDLALSLEENVKFLEIIKILEK